MENALKLDLRLVGGVAADLGVVANSILQSRGEDKCIASVRKDRRVFAQVHHVPKASAGATKNLTPCQRRVTLFI
jgi:hypothetical protein